MVSVKARRTSGESSVSTERESWAVWARCAVGKGMWRVLWRKGGLVRVFRGEGRAEYTGYKGNLLVSSLWRMTWLAGRCDCTLFFFAMAGKIWYRSDSVSGRCYRLFLRKKHVMQGW